MIFHIEIHSNGIRSKRFDLLVNQITSPIPREERKKKNTGFPWEHPISANLFRFIRSQSLFLCCIKKKKAPLEKKRQKKLGKAMPDNYNNFGYIRI